LPSEEKLLVKIIIIKDEKSIKDVLTAAGVKVDDAKVAQIVKECTGKDVLKVLYLLLSSLKKD
jgi:ribosomal protein L12E/L44/L45/RPP1/RPP2